MFKFCWHKFEDKEVHITKNICFGFAGAMVPGMRVKQVCKKCDKVRYISLNISMPNKYLYKEGLWKKLH